MNTKGNMEHYFSLIIWCFILVLTIYIINKSSTIYLKDDLRSNATLFCSNFISDFGVNLFEESAPIIKYSMTDPTSKVASNNLVTIFADLFPVNQYLFNYTNTKEANTITNVVVNSVEPIDTTPIDEISTTLKPSTDQTMIGYTGSDIYYEDDENLEDVVLNEEAQEAMASNVKKIEALKKDKDLSYLLKNFYTVNSVTGVDKKTFNVSKLLAKDLTITKNSAQPQILIYHTHAHETFADSRKGEVDDTIVGVGRCLTQILTEKYGYNVIHHETAYDKNHKMAYSAALPEIEQILKDNPSIEVVLDLHRDAGSDKTAIQINGKSTAKIMFFNGVSRNNNGPIDYLYNPNLKTNLSFSLQMKLISMQVYPEFAKRIFLKSYRYNMHLRGRYSLVEVGDDKNTVAEVKNAMEPLADILNRVLSTK